MPILSGLSLYKQSAHQLQVLAQPHLSPFLKRVLFQCLHDPQYVLPVKAEAIDTRESHISPVGVHSYHNTVRFKAVLCK